MNGFAQLVTAIAALITALVGAMAYMHRDDLGRLAGAAPAVQATAPASGASGDAGKTQTAKNPPAAGAQPRFNRFRIRELSEYKH